MVQARKSPSGLFWALILLAVAALFVMRAQRPERPTQLIGQPLPPLEVAGWFNTDRPPANDDLRGKVVLVDFWASWCGPCVAKMPKLVEFHQKYRGEGLVLVGLTPESGDEVADVESYVKSVAGLDWPIAYGAELPIDALGVEAFPTLILFDKSGRSVWAGHGFEGLGEAVTAALLQQPSS